MAKIIPARIYSEGHEMSELGICKPRWRKCCPENSKFVEIRVNVLWVIFPCLLKLDGNHYCEPAHSESVKPNGFACHNGQNIFKESAFRTQSHSRCPLQSKFMAPNRWAQIFTLSGHKISQGINVKRRFLCEKRGNADATLAWVSRRIWRDSQAVCQWKKKDSLDRQLICLFCILN